MEERADSSILTDAARRLGPSDQEWRDSQKLAQDCGVPFVSLEEGSFDQALMKKIPTEVLLTYKMLPISQDGGVLTLAMTDPLDVVAEDVVRLVSGCRVRRVVAPPSQIMEAIQGRLGQTETLVDAILSRIPDGGDITYIQSSDTVSEEQTPAMEDLQPTAPVIQLVSSIIGDAIRMNASDIHVEPQKLSMRVRYRLDGYLRTIVELPKRVQSSCITRFKIISGLDISESRKPQDGRTRAILEGREIDLRVSSLPTYYGEKLVLRILDPKAVKIDLDDLGFSGVDFEQVTQVLSSSQGMILCTGPTGSGKTSTLYSSLRRINQEADNIVTVEDPIEYQLEGVNQVQVNPRAGMTFASALRSILRQDPDVVLIGEIRDLETAEIAVQAAQTGHLVLSTLHTNDALSTVSRLVLMGVEPYMLASSLLCVVAQRLVRRLCPNCRQVGQPGEHALRMLRAAGVVSPPTTCYQPVGCERCNFVGYRGRLGLFELLTVTDRVRALLLERASESQIERLARSEGMHTLLEDGLRKSEEGLTSLDEVLRVVTIRRVGGRRCPHCDASVPPEHLLCVYCGNPLLLLCEHCRTPLEADWRMCPQCQEWVVPPQALAIPPTSAPTALVEEPAVITLPDERMGEQTWVLLVTDDILLSNQLAACLLEREYCVLTADDVAKAMTLTHYHRPDLVVLDIDTPDLDAARWIGHLRSRLESALIAVILLTDRGRSGEGGIRGLDSGADSYLLKPVDENRFLARVCETMQRLPRMVPPFKAEALPGLGVEVSASQVPPIFTDPLRRALAALERKNEEWARQEVSLLALIIVQYTFSTVAAVLRAFDRLPPLPVWDDSASVAAFEEKVALLPKFTSALELLRNQEPFLSDLLHLAQTTVADLPELATIAQPPEATSVVDPSQGLDHLRPWLEAAQPLFCRTEHYWSESVAGEVCCVVQLEELSLELESGLQIHTSLHSRPVPPTKSRSRARGRR